MHDELVFEIKNDLVLKIVPKIKKCMEGVLSLEDTKKVPLVVDVKAGANWNKMEKI